jgi:hypothetical protein
MLAEVRRSDFLPIRSFAGHCRSFVGLNLRPMRSPEAPQYLFRLNSPTDAENFGAGRAGATPGT